MLDSLDTLIAFVLIMLVVSLLITIVVQMFAAALNLRGRNLLSGLGSVIAVIDPSLEADKHKLAEYLLKGRLLSDSCLPIKLKSPKWPEWMQKWVKALRPTTAARPQELFDAVHRVAMGNEYQNPESPTEEEKKLVENAKQVLAALGVRAESLSDASKAAKDLGDKIGNAVAVLPDGPLKTDAKAALAQVGSKLDDFETAAVRIGAKTAGNIDAAYNKFHYYTCICEERAQQWLTMHTRILTVIFATVFAFWLQLDTVEIFKLVSSNKAVRDKLVAQATAVSSQAEKILGNSPTVLQNAYDKWLQGVKETAVKSALTSPSPAPVHIAATDTREHVTGQIENALAKIDKDVREAALKSFNNEVDASVSDDLRNESRDYREVQDNFKGTGFDLFPTGSRWPDGWSWVHVFGVLCSVGLLSLGAPFWYHTLKDLVSLRSQVAQNIAEQKDKAGTDGKPPDAPPTVKSPHDTEPQQATSLVASQKVRFPT